LFFDGWLTTGLPSDRSVASAGKTGCRRRCPHLRQSRGKAHIADSAALPYLQT